MGGSRNSKEFRKEIQERAFVTETLIIIRCSNGPRLSEGPGGADQIFMLFGISDNYVLCARRGCLARGRDRGPKGVALPIVK